MPKIEYVPKKFRSASLDVIEASNEIITQYQADGYDLTLRMLFYQLVTENIIPNTVRSYKNLGSLISDARLAGLIDWNSIVDRTRITQTHSAWTEPGSILESAYHSYDMDHWSDQVYRPRVWVEKDALVGVISRVCNEYRVPFLACRGYMSQSAMWRDAQKASHEIAQGKSPIIIHLGDHDPSGIDMTRDITERMEIFGASYEVRRIALNNDQVTDLNLPPNPAKLTDTRAEGYVSEYGYSSWELDALRPDYINRLIEEQITGLIDYDIWDQMKHALRVDKATLRTISQNYEFIQQVLEDEGLL